MPCSGLLCWRSIAKGQEYSLGKCTSIEHYQRQRTDASLIKQFNGDCYHDTIETIETNHEFYYFRLYPYYPAPFEQLLSFEFKRSSSMLALTVIVHYCLISSNRSVLHRLELNSTWLFRDSSFHRFFQNANCSGRTDSSNSKRHDM
jgi:hypothetical protein